jgi:hypothetical protein
MTRLHTLCGDHVTVTRIGGLLTLSMIGDEQINLLQRVLDAYLNTKPESVAWLWTLSDALNPVSVPERYKDRA